MLAELIQSANAPTLAVRREKYLKALLLAISLQHFYLAPQSRDHE